MTDWQPINTRGSISQYLAPALVFLAAIAAYILAVI